MDKSKFNLWRACFSFCFVDGFLSPKEEEWIQSKLETLAFSDEQKKTLISDMKARPDIDQLLPLIERPADKGFLVNQMRLLSQLDNQISPQEKLKIDSALKAIMSRIDTKALEQQVIKEEQEIYSKMSYTEKLISSLLKNS